MTNPESKKEESASSDESDLDEKIEKLKSLLVHAYQLKAVVSRSYCSEKEE